MRATMEGLRVGLDTTMQGLERVVTEAMREASTGLKQSLRSQVVGAGLGERLARTWRNETYPRTGTSLRPTAYVHSHAPEIINFFDAGLPVRASGGRFLAIPTDDTPRKRGGQPFTVAEVQQKFGRRLQFVSPSDSGFASPSARRGGVAFLVLKDLVVRKSSQRWRNAGPSDSKRGRQAQAVIMFILVPVVRGQKKLDIAQAAQLWAGKIPVLIDRQLGTMP